MPSLDPLALELIREGAGHSDEGQLIPRGPRGGNLNNPRQQPEARRSPLKNMREDGSIGLHQYQDRAMNGVQDEQPWHHMAALLMLQGVDNGTIARAARVSNEMISTLRAQRWFQELLVSLADDQACGLIGLLRSELPNAIQNIIDIANDPKASARVRLAANQDLVDRVEGKAITRVVSSTHVSRKSPDEEMADIQSELEMIRKSEI